MHSQHDRDIRSMNDPSSQKGLDQLSDEAELGIVTEFIEFLKYNKKWWLLPILLVMAVVGAVALISGTGVAPFIYTLF